jgi:A/G-specific adenine glycosylase
MLQQTQVERVVPKYKSFLKKFPTIKILSKAPLSAVLKEWQGLGYNRRAKMLQDSARALVHDHGGKFPKSKEALMGLPGVGPYTASAVRVFAFNESETLVETNVRSVFIHHFFPKKTRVPDSRLYPYIDTTLDKRNPREWYSALMDYGSFLKRTAGNASRRSAHHVRQKPFKGSNREVRGAILRAISTKNQSDQALLKLGFPKVKLLAQKKALLKEGLIVRISSSFSLPK